MKEMDFTNEPIAPADLPRYEMILIRPVHPSYWYVILINVVFVTIVIGGVAAVPLYMAMDSDIPGWSVLGGWLLFMTVQLVIRRVAFRQRGYAVREHDVIYRKGVLATVTTIVPFNRIQHVSINEGMLSRRFGLAEIQVFTAGGTAANMSISGLPKVEAERIKAYIMESLHETEGTTVDSIATEKEDE